MSNSSRTISSACLLTAPGSAAIAVVRLTGPAVPGFIADHFAKPAKIARCVHGDLMDGKQIIDDAVVVLVDQDTADLNLHGGPWVVQRMLNLLAQKGFEVRSSLEFPLIDEAIDGDTTLNSEVLSHLPLARTELGVRVLLAQTHAWEKLKSAGVPDAADLRCILADRTLNCLLHPRRLALIGAANVGKSTLANQLFARERSITADVPGTTRDWVGEIANVNGLPVMLLDTPGMRDTEDPIEMAAIQRSRGEIGRTDGLILLIDASRPLEGEQSRLLEEFPSAIRVVNKVDRPFGWASDPIGAINTVATIGHGVEELRREIVRSFCGQESIEIAGPRCWTDRQRAVIASAIEQSQRLADL